MESIANALPFLIPTIGNSVDENYIIQRSFLAHEGDCGDFRGTANLSLFGLL